MDPSSLSLSNDPHHTPQFTAYPPFTNSNPYAGTNQHFFGDAANHAAVGPPNDNHLFQAPPMICTAIAALNEHDGSSKQAISRYIERIYTGLPPAHTALLTHHLKTLKNSGILMMVKKSYKFAAAPEPPRSDFTVNNENKALPDPAATSTPQTQNRGRGRPPKPKPDVASDLQLTNGKPTLELTELPVSRPEEEIQQPPSIKRPPGRPRKDGTSPSPRVPVQDSPTVQAAPPSIARRRGKPPSGRAAGRERKPTIVSAPVSVIPYVANGGGVRRRGRPRRVDAGASSSVAPPNNAESGGGEGVALVVVKRRGRGRPPKIGGVTRKLMKPIRRVSRTGRPLGRPRKDAVSRGPSGVQDAASYGELKTKFELFQARAKDIVVVLKAEIGASENQAVVQAIQLLEELTATETREEPQHMEEVQAEVEHPEPQSHPQPEPQSEPQPEAEAQGQGRTEAEAMQEALF